MDEHTSRISAAARQGTKLSKRKHSIEVSEVARRILQVIHSPICDLETLIRETWRMMLSVRRRNAAKARNSLHDMSQLLPSTSPLTKVHLIFIFQMALIARSVMAKVLLLSSIATAIPVHSVSSILPGPLFKRTDYVSLVFRRQPCIDMIIDISSRR